LLFILSFLCSLSTIVVVDAVVELRFVVAVVLCAIAVVVIFSIFLVSRIYCVKNLQSLQYKCFFLLYFCCFAAWLLLMCVRFLHAWFHCDLVTFLVICLLLLLLYFSTDTNKNNNNIHTYTYTLYILSPHYSTFMFELRQNLIIYLLIPQNLYSNSQPTTHSLVDKAKCSFT